MSLRSMTGFGQAESATPSGTFRVEVRSVNNRFLDVQIRLPRLLANLEAKIKKVVTDTVSRGSMQVAVSWDKESEQGRLTWDRAMALEYARILREMKETCGLAGEVTVTDMLGFTDLLKPETTSFDEKTVWSHVSPVLESAVTAFQEARETEGNYIGRDLGKMLGKLSKMLAQIEKKAPARLARYTSELKRKIESLAGSQVDEQRIATEIAVMADKLDISEECTRLRAHIEKFSADLESTGPAGKRMGFLLQEMNREANTIGSKANDTVIAHMSVTLKEIVEQIREQIQNIE